MSRPAFRRPLTGIWIYPVKSLPGLRVESSRVLPSGALENDRRFVMCDRDGRKVTGKREPKIHTVHAEFEEQGSIIRLAGERYSLEAQRVEIEEQLSVVLGYGVVLQENIHSGFPDDVNAPGPTLVSQGTIAQVAHWFPHLDSPGIFARFRANLEVAGDVPFEEDALVGEEPVPFRIGDLSFEGLKVCARCSVPPRDPRTGEVESTFKSRFANLREETLPPWSPRDKFDHFYRLAVNTRLVTFGEDDHLRIGDVVSAGAPK